MTWKIPEERFDQRREPYLRYATYPQLLNEHLGGVAMVTTDLPKHVKKARAGGLMTSTRRRLWSTLDWMSPQYSAGAPVKQWAEVWPHAQEWAEEYGSFHAAYHTSVENTSGDITPHVALVSEEYWIVALRLVCFGLLTGHAAQMPRVMAFLDYANAGLDVYDGLLERLIAPYVSGRPTPPDIAARHLPYRKLFEVFSAQPEQRPSLMATYLDEWYHASRREPYVDQHGEGDVDFYGYWSWEAAATTVVLGIDDSSYRDMAFYPKDLADFARDNAASKAVLADATPDRVLASEPVPRDGWWYTPARLGSRRYFKQGEVFPNIVDTDYGNTFWIWDRDQTTRTLT
ncbi:DUF1911 domain-containing protein [Bacillus subtilis subsp. subtilis]|nr:DUF1911 domain-containing protein [Bacillus subtilis subsp. subtilis]